MTKRRISAVTLTLSLCLVGNVFAGPDEEALANIEHDFAEVQITKDPATLARVAAVMDDGFRFTDATSRDPGTPKEQVLAGLVGPGKLVIRSMDFRPFTIRIFRSTAIVEGVNSGHATFAGQEVGGTFAWVDVFEKRDGHWVWLFSQSGKVGEKLSDKDPCSRAPCPQVHPGFSVGR
jgi:hypothetical protein